MAEFAWFPRRKSKLLVVNVWLKLVRARMECLIAINLFPLETWRKDSPLRRFSNLPQTKNETLVSLISCFGWGRNVRGCKGRFPLSRNFYLLTGVKFTCVKQKGYDQFMRISDIAEHSRYENFALTRMFYKHFFVIQIYQAAMVNKIGIILLVLSFPVGCKG